VLFRSTRAASLETICRLAGVPVPRVIRIGANAVPGPRRPRRAAAVPRLGIFSTAAAGKRLDIVLDAFARVAAELPSAELVLIGDLGPPDRPTVREVLDAVARHPARARIRLTGGLSLDEVAREIADLDVYLFTMETGANTRSGTLPAALGAGLPVVAMRGKETDDALFRSGDNVVFARDLSAPAFAEATLALLRDPALLARVGDGAHRLYAEHMSWEVIVDRFLAEA
jgi:glycosyltransferase involved in cell wall biosynthesis